MSFANIISLYLPFIVCIPCFLLLEGFQEYITLTTLQPNLSETPTLLCLWRKCYNGLFSVSFLHLSWPPRCKKKKKVDLILCLMSTFARLIQWTLLEMHRISTYAEHVHFLLLIRLRIHIYMISVRIHIDNIINIRIHIWNSTSTPASESLPQTK